MHTRPFLYYLSALLITLFLLFVPELFWQDTDSDDDQTLRIMSYSSFLQEEGAGPELSQLFYEQTGIRIKWINAGNAGLLIERLKFKRDSDRPDLIMGFDQFSILEARKSFKFLELRDLNRKLQNPHLPSGSKQSDFLAYDWGPMTFIYRNNEVVAPIQLDDLLKEDYESRLILPDPRMSSPGLQFLLWVIGVKGEDAGFDFLKKLQPSIRVMPPSWSSSYSLFKSTPGTMVFSYLTSPYYHKLEENSEAYKAAAFNDPLPVQVEYAAIPQFCGRCDQAMSFMNFLITPGAQKILMNKNYMYPVALLPEMEKDFPWPEKNSYLDPIETLRLINKKKELINRWKTVFY